MYVCILLFAAVFAAKVCVAVGACFALSAILLLSVGAEFWDSGYSFPANDYYRLKNAQSGMYLDVPNASTSNIYPVIQYPYHGGNNQLWYLNRYSGDVYSFTPTHRPNSYLNVYMEYTTSGTNIGVYGQSVASANSKWRIIPNREDGASSQLSGSYRLEASYASGKVAKAITNVQSAPVQLMNYSDNSATSPTQFDEWIFFTSGNVPVSLMNEHLVDSGKHLDLKFASDVPQAFKLNILQTAGTWNGQKPGVIRDNTSNQFVTDITVEMASDAALKGAVASTTPSGKIRLNTKYFNEDSNNWYSLSESQRKMTCAHELGHALGLNHQHEGYDSSNVSTRKRNVMKAGTSSEFNLSEGDKASYNLSWRKY